MNKVLVAKSELSYYPEEILEVSEKKTKSLKNRKVAKKKKNNSNIKLSFIGIATMFLILSLSILFRYANITKVRSEITQLEREKIELEKTKQDLIAELEGIKSSSRIEEDAIYKLGMDYPSEEQIVYLTINEVSTDIDGDKVTIVKQLKNIISMVSSLF
ncbi:cell division protein FtsL [Tissierella sp. MSJ-40]|uniref:Cell division protein FtsL n=1 Tax=Tissierella simiarum TaxID=2841534 RepID=A0ABS6E5I9_9FIRM|nr:cell division protein FtsL [Tissierella simiarum]